MVKNTATSTHWFSEILKDSFMKIIFKIIITVVCVFVLYILGKALLGYHVKVLGIEVNIPELKNNVQIISEKDTSKSAPIYPISNKSEFKEIPKPIKTYNVYTPLKSNAILKKPNEETKTTSKYNIKAPIFNAPSQIGNNNIQNNNTGIKQRTLTVSELKDIISQIPDKNSFIQMGLYNNAGKEGEIYASQIANSLIGNGYKNVQNGLTQIMLFSNSPSSKNYEVSTTVGYSIITISIYPANNIE